MWYVVFTTAWYSQTALQSVAAEHTFSNLSSEVYMMERLESIAQSLEHRLKKHNISGKTITLKLNTVISHNKQSKTVPILFLTEV
jgi:DNA polymerase-4